MTNICPVCGYPELHEPAYTGDSGKPMIASLEICPSCHYHFGYDDDDQKITHQQWRENWVLAGMPWRSAGRQPPQHWNPIDQLGNIGIKI